MENKNSGPENSFGFYPGFGDNRNIFSYPVPCHDYVLYIDDLSWLEDHQERLQLIRMATPEDSIRIVINSPGGAVAIAMAYVNAMAESAANIVTHAEGQVCSAGTILWLASEERTVSPLTIFMFHNYQGGTYGDGANMHSQIMFEKVYFDRLIDRFYSGILSEEEIARIRGGGQVWMDEMQVLERADAVLLDAKNIKRMQQGKPPVSLRKVEAPAETPAEPTEPKRVKIRIELNGVEHILDAATLDEPSLAQFATKELFAILVQVAGLAGDDILSERSINGDTPREALIDNLKVYGQVVTDMLLNDKGE
ncbi:putative ATP-dependent Clp protease proteolytic subunit [Erwinia phage Hena1]|uniref:Putative ATP-dependent Clp protease proteolytic subunit n=1 Tax=Erwinia phage Hena1 TaxID=2678601 RepID=A0A6B9J5R5_9CAUD|nr:ATP-dependent protease [Erwinia phage Hena1]QGZ16215.1 putative ATP-dependent Clp protease proteolytic subunit [Erwinia phage Hena1]